MNSPKALLSNLDNAILAFDIAGDQARRHVCEKFAPGVNGLESAVLLKAVEEARDVYWDDPERYKWGRLNVRTAQRKIVSAAFTRLSIEASHVSDQIADEYSILREEFVEPLPGAIGILEMQQADAPFVAW